MSAGLGSRETKERTGEIEARTVRIWALTLLPPLLVANAVTTGTVDAGHLAGSGLDIISQKFFWLPKLGVNG